MPVLPATSLDATFLFIRLKRLGSDGKCPSELPGNVLSICQKAADRLKIFPAIHGQFTLHDETHCLRVVELIANVATFVLEQLNAVEIALLILAAYFHDQGMIVEAKELETIRLSDDWKTHEQNWSSDNPNYGEAIVKLNDPLIGPAERNKTIAIIADLRSAMFTDFIRKTHGERSAKFVQAEYGGDPRLVLYSRSISDLLARLCLSHVRPAESITSANGYALDELVGTTKVNVALLAFLLRLADILDFDRERTPDSLYRAIHFTSPISLQEWEKHRSITGWDIAPDRIIFAASCTHPAYERAIRQFFVWIDIELSACHSWGRSLPAEFQHHRLHLPQKVDASRVGPQVDPVSSQPMYRYFDLEFALSRNEIVKLLMTEGLYTNRSLFIRELLQNSLDALRHRQALYKTDDVEVPDMSVRFEHLQESGFDIVRCSDDGVGMDETIITRFLTRVGRSYYRSPEFDRERTRFREKGCDFDPCARFGIGFMSCFMFGDEILIQTRRDYGMGRAYGAPLIVEIKGLSGIIVIRPGPADQPIGTTVEIQGRRKSFTVDMWSDPVNLLEVLNGYALAAEFSITGKCSVAAIEGSVVINPMAICRPHPIETIDGPSKVVFNVDLATINKNLRGEIRTCFLADPSGIPCVGNAEGQMRIRHDIPGQTPKRTIALTNGKETEINGAFRCHQVCCDGIIVAGDPGRGERLMRLGMHACNDGFGDAAFLIDARGDLKPFLTPARTPPSAMFREEPTWRNLFNVAGRGYSKLLDNVLDRCIQAGEPERFWLIAEAYALDLYYLNLVSVWRHLRFPVEDDGGNIQWLAARDLGRPRLIISMDEKETHTFTVTNKRGFKFPKGLVDLRSERAVITELLLEQLIGSMSDIVSVSENEFELNLNEPPIGLCLNDVVIRKMSSWRWFLRCSGNFKSVICVTGTHGFANLEHPLVQRGRSLENKPWDEYSPLERIIGRLSWGNVGERFDSEPSPGSWTARSRMELGLLYLAVDWDSVDASLRPPYTVFRPGVGVDVMTTDHLQEWAHLKPAPN